MNRSSDYYKSAPELIEKPRLHPNNHLRQALNSIAGKMPGARNGGENPVDSLNPDEISYLQAYLEQVKIDKINKLARAPIKKYCTNNKPINTWSNSINYGACIPKGIDVQPAIPGQDNQSIVNTIPNNRTTDIYDPDDRGVPEPGFRGATTTRKGKKGYDINQSNDYCNPYEYGSRQNELGSVYKPTYTGPYTVDNNPDLLSEIGLSENLYFEKFPGDVRNVNVESTLLQKELTHGPGQRRLTETELNRFELLPFDPQDVRHIVWKDNMPRNGYPTRTDRLEMM
jgi:hypothetical protein